MATELLKCGYSKLENALSVKYPPGCEDLVPKKECNVSH